MYVLVCSASPWATRVLRRPRVCQARACLLRCGCGSLLAGAFVNLSRGPVSPRSQAKGPASRSLAIDGALQ